MNLTGIEIDTHQIATDWITFQLLPKLENAPDDTAAKSILGSTAAGPLEDLLAYHGIDFIEKIETKARQDRRMFWTLGCVWQNAMPDEIWERVQRAAGGISR